MHLAVNTYIYQDLVPILALGENPHIYPLNVTHLQASILCPDYLKYGMLCMVLSHRINKTRNDLPHGALAAKFYRYWGLAVRSLNEHLCTEDRWGGDTVIAGILTLLLADVSYHTPRHKYPMLTHVVSFYRSSMENHSIGDAI